VEIRKRGKKTKVRRRSEKTCHRQDEERGPGGGKFRGWTPENRVYRRENGWGGQGNT